MVQLVKFVRRFVKFLMLEVLVYKISDIWIIILILIFCFPVSFSFITSQEFADADGLADNLFIIDAMAVHARRWVYAMHLLVGDM